MITVFNRKVFIDAGHGGKDPGAVGPSGLRESDVCLQISYLIAKSLNALNFRVTMSRDDNSSLSIANRASKANELNADIFISIHCNAATSNAKGLETWYANGSKNGILLASALQESIVNCLLPTNRGIKNDSTNERFKNGITILRQTKMPAALIELDFISNPQIEMILSSPKIQEKYASAVAVGVNRYFEIL